MKIHLNNKRNKLLTSIIIVILSLSVLTTIYLNTTTKPLLVFKENIIFEYGSKASDIKFDDLVIKEKSKYEKIEFINDNKIDTMKIGKASIKLLVTYKDKTLEYILNYEVKDTKKPIISGKDLETSYNTKLDLSKYFSAKDIVDGSLKVDIKENIDYTKAGKYEIMVSAKDKNNLETISKYQVVVKDKKVITTTTTNNQSNTNNNNNTDDYYEDNDYDSSYDNSNSNVSHNSGSDNNSDGGSGKCRLPFKEDENGNCYAIAEEINFDNIYFDHDTWVDEYGVTHVFIRKYKDIHACIAAQDEIFDEIFNVYNNEYSGYFCDFNGDLWFYD